MTDMIEFNGIFSTIGSYRAAKNSLISPGVFLYEKLVKSCVKIFVIQSFTINEMVDFFSQYQNITIPNEHCEVKIIRNFRLILKPFFTEFFGWFYPKIKKNLEKLHDIKNNFSVKFISDNNR